MNIWLFPFADPIINTILRGFTVALVAVYGFKTSWYKGYWLAILHDIVSLILIRDMV